MSTTDHTASTPGSSGRVGTERLDGNIGVVNLIFTVIAYNGPMVVFLGFIPVAILLGDGIGTPTMFLACGVVALLFAAGLVDMGLRLPKPGGFYTYACAGLGKVVGLGAGLSAMVCYYSALIAGFTLGGEAARSVVHDVLGGPQLPWWVYGTMMFVAIGYLGYVNIAFSARVLTAFLTLELLLMASYAASVLIRGGAHGLGLDSFTWHAATSGSVPIAFLFGIGLFGGFEATVIFRDEVKRPEKTIPHATYAVVAVLAVLYAVTAWAFVNAYGPQAVMAAVQDNLVGASADSVKQYTGTWAYDAANVLLVTSCFALALASHNIVARYLYNLSADGVVMRSLSRVHVRHSSPHRASLAISVAAGVGIFALAGDDGSDAYTKLAGIYSFTFTLLIVLAALAITVYLFRHRAGSRATTARAAGSGAAFVLLAVALGLATKNFGLLTGTTGVLTWVLLLLILGITAGGMVLAVWYRGARPDVYARIGREDAPEDRTAEAVA